MRTRDREALVLLGLGVLAMLTHERDGVAWGDGWHFPVPDLRLELQPGIGLFPATVTSGFRTPNRPDHVGLDIMYTRQPGQAPAFPVGVPDAEGGKHEARYFAPMRTPILAARAGKVWSVRQMEHGIEVVLDHGRPWATRYVHLKRTHLLPHANGKNLATGGEASTVRAGEQIGEMGFNPLDGAKLRHLHFEAWYKGAGNSAAQNPSGVLSSWGRSSWQT